jgi:FlaA1/EpsC-like NDP-sugar epimerase
MNEFFNDMRVLVTGACGTIGRELVRQLLEKHQVGELIAIDNNESELFFLEQKFSNHSNSSFFLADIRDPDKLSQILKHINLVFHTAAFKHVISCERSPFEAVQTNILGVQNLINAARDKNVGRIIFTSSDKAVNPTSVMGTSKLMGERLMTAANSNSRAGDTVFCSTRFGNVLGSRGSVIPIFREQIKRGGPITLTDPEMTRFIMSIKEAIRLVIESAFLAIGGEVFITKMPVINIQDLAEVMIAELAPQYGHSPSDIPIEIIGTQPGEKMYEELMSIEETRRSWELQRYFVVLPAYGCIYQNVEYKYDGVLKESVSNPYNSSTETSLSKDQLTEFLKANDLLEEDPTEGRHPAERFWPNGSCEL